MSLYEFERRRITHFGRNHTHEVIFKRDFIYGCDAVSIGCNKLEVTVKNFFLLSFPMKIDANSHIINSKSCLPFRPEKNLRPVWYSPALPVKNPYPLCFSPCFESTGKAQIFQMEQAIEPEPHFLSRADTDLYLWFTSDHVLIR